MKADSVIRKFAMASSATLLAVSFNVQAVMIGFEGFAPAGDFTYVNVGTPYSEAGFVFTPSVDLNAAVFDSASGWSLPGDDTDYLGFNDNNPITMTFTGGSFSLDSLLLGAMNPPNIPTSGAIVGNFSGGGFATYNFTDLVAATLINLNWTDLTSVVFRATSDAGIDNLIANTVPEPATLALTALGLAGLGFATRRRTRCS